MAYKSHQPSPLFLKKPNLLVSSFSKVNSATLTHGSSPTKATSNLDISFSPTRVPFQKAKSLLLTTHQDSSPMSRSKPVHDNHILFEDPQEDEDDKKATIKFGKAMQLQKINLEDKKEESRERYKTVRKYVRELKAIRLFEDEEGRLLNKKKILEESEKIIRLAENVFVMMNIRVKEMTEPLSDSAMTIYPIDDRQELANFYKMLIPEICEFPYVFLAKLKIFLITICSEVCMFTSGYNSVLAQKMNNGLFILKDMQACENVRNHLYNIIVNHFVKADPEMFEEWKELVRAHNSTIIRRKHEMKSELEELIISLKCVMRPQDVETATLPQIQSKIKFVKRKLLNFEPICFDEEWWDMKYNEDLYHKI